jgi:hypothetical protein
LNYPLNVKNFLPSVQKGILISIRKAKMINDFHKYTCYQNVKNTL